MILCNLEKILDERRLSVLKLAEKAGLSRTAINPLYHNTGTAVHFETIDKLCKTLNVTLDELFSHSNLQKIEVYFHAYSLFEINKENKTINAKGQLIIDNYEFPLIAEISESELTWAPYYVQISITESTVLIKKSEKENIYNYHVLMACEPKAIIDLLKRKVESALLERAVGLEDNKDIIVNCSALEPIITEELTPKTLRDLLLFIKKY